jgi:uncharacterized lipoprotein YajG
MKSMFPLLRLVLALFASALLGACSDPATTLVPRPPGGDFVLQATAKGRSIRAACAARCC